MKGSSHYDVLLFMVEIISDNDVLDVIGEDGYPTRADAPAFNRRIGFLPIPVGSKMEKYRDLLVFQQLRVKVMQLWHVFERGFDLGAERARLGLPKTGLLTAAQLERISYDDLIRAYRVQPPPGQGDQVIVSDELNAEYVSGAYHLIVRYLTLPPGRSSVSVRDVTAAIKGLPDLSPEELRTTELMLITSTIIKSQQVAPFMSLQVQKKTIWTWSQLQSYPRGFALQPAAFILPPAQTVQFFELRPEIQRINLPVVREDDAMSRWLGVNSGQLIVYRRVGGKEDGTPYFRIVV